MSDQYDDQAAVLLPCVNAGGYCYASAPDGVPILGHHAACPAIRRPNIAAALRELETKLFEARSECARKAAYITDLEKRAERAEADVKHVNQCLGDMEELYKDARREALAEAKRCPFHPALPLMWCDNCVKDHQRDARREALEEAVTAVLEDIESLDDDPAFQDCLALLAKRVRALALAKKPK